MKFYSKKNTDVELIPATSTDPAYRDLDVTSAFSNPDTADGRDQYTMILSNNTVVTGQYLILKYRNAAVKNMIIHSSTTHAAAGSETYTKEYTGLSTEDGWHVAVIDLTVTNAAVAPDVDTDADGVNDAYSVNFLRIGFGTGLALEQDIIDIAYFGFCDNLAAAENFITASGDDDICDYDFTAAE